MNRPEDIYVVTKAPAACPDSPAYVEVSFEAGVPVAVNGVSMSLTDLIGSLQTIGGAHGVGRIDMVENRLVGIKSREIYEAPAATILHAAHAELEKLVITRDLERLKHDLARIYADLVYNGLWVHADARGPRRVRCDNSAAGDGRRSSEAVQR